MKEMSQKYSEDVAFIFRNFPLSSIHPNARAAAAAAESAGLLGKYWEMHDKLYENQNNWETLSGQDRTNTFASYAVSLGMDKDKFIAGLTDERVLNKIDYDTALGTKVGVSGTPSIYVNGKIADQSVKDGKLVAGNNTDPLVWSSSDLFDKYAVDPAIKAAK
jgi:protein-disulfide isomerase